MSTVTVHTVAGNRQSAGSQSVAGTGKEKTDEAPLHIPSLDGIRAFAFLSVFTANAGFGDYVPGYFGISVFF